MTASHVAKLHASWKRARATLTKAELAYGGCLPAGPKRAAMMALIDERGRAWAEAEREWRLAIAKGMGL